MNVYKNPINNKIENMANEFCSLVSFVRMYNAYNIGTITYLHQ